MFSPIVDENRIVLDWFRLVDELHQESGVIPKEGRPRADPPSTTPPAIESITPASSVPNTMADKTLHEYSIPIVANVPIGPAVNMGDANFKLKTSLIKMVQGRLVHLSMEWQKRK